MTDSLPQEDQAARQQLWQLATAVRDACFTRALTAYEDAGMDGLCRDGAWECALDAMRSLDFEAVITQTIADSS